jgi:hypothetical protein
MYKAPHRSLSVLLAVLFLFVLTMSAQEYRGSISGLVKDPQGAFVTHASIVAKSPEQTYNSKTDSKGAFYIPYVQPGTYIVTVTSPGFMTSVHDNVVVDVAAQVNQSFVLVVGAVSDTVSVNENTLQLNTEDASGGTVLDPDLVQNLPLNGRQVYTLLNLTPGVLFTQTQFGAGGYSGTRAWDTSNAYSITGQPGSYNQFMLNGAPISVQGGGGAGTWNIAPSIDAVQEVKVMTITFDAQYGRVGGGGINTILKNGSPHFHGTLFDYWRNSIFDANTYNLNQQGTPKPFHNEHDFGGTIGGPFLKHNGFFFFSYEGYREVLPAGVVTTVPTSDLFPGSDGSVDLTNFLTATGRTNGIFDPLTTSACIQQSGGSCVYTRQPFAGNIIPADRVSPIGVAILKLFPAPNRPGYTNNYVFNGKDRYRYNMPIARVDYNLSDRTKFYGIFAWWAGHEYRNGNGLIGPAITGDIDNYRSSLTQVLDLTHTFTPSLVADIRASFNRYYYQDPNGSVAAGLNTLTAGDLGLTMPQIPTTSKKYAPAINLGDNFPGVIGNEVNPNIFETYDIGPSVTQTLGNHNLHYGAEFSLYHDVPSGIGDPNGSFSFGTDYTQNNPFKQAQDGSVIADLLLGYPDSGGVDYDVAPYESYRYVAGFVQDNWKVFSNFTINAGIRWDEEFSPIERHNRLLAGMCLTCVNPISASVPSLAPLLGTVLFASGSQPAYPNNTELWQPKLGFSWGFDKKFVLHGGYTYSKALGIELGGASAWNETTGYNASPDGGLHPNNFFNNGNPYPNGYITPPGSSQGALALVGTGFGIDMRDRKIPKVEQYTLGIQAQMPFGMVGELVYLGAHTYNLRASKQLNGLSASDFAEGHANPTYLDQQVPNPFYGVLPNTVALGQNPTIQARYLKVPYPAFDGNIYDYTYPGGYSNYNSMLAKLEKRISGNGALIKGLSFLAGFSWSRLIDGTGFLNNGGASLVDPAPYYGIDGSNRPWTFSFSGNYGIPIGKGGAVLADVHGVTNMILSDWHFDWIFQNAGGTPVGYPNGENFNCGTYNILPAHRTYKSYLNNSQNTCFSTFTEYTATTKLPLTTAILAPYAQQTSIGLEKKFPIREGMNLQFKAEAFNVTNTAIFGSPATGSPDQIVTRNLSVGNPNQPGAWSGYGTIGSTQQNFPRQMQMSLKLAF